MTTIARRSASVRSRLNPDCWFTTGRGGLWKQPIWEVHRLAEETGFAARCMREDEQKSPWLFGREQTIKACKAFDAAYRKTPA